MNAVLENIIKRRSIRKYHSSQIDNEALRLIIEAGRYAPSGGNNQTTHILVIQNEAVLKELKALVVEEFSKMEVTENMYKSLAASIRQSKKGEYDFTYGAPTLIVVSNKRGYGNAMADCSVVLENMMLAATSLDIGSCWINQLRWLAEGAEIIQYMEKLGISKEEVICGGLSLGYAESFPVEELSRNGNKVDYIR